MREDEENKELTEDDYLRRHLDSIEKNKKTETPKKQVDTTRIVDLQFFSFDIREFPCNIFYPAGTLFQIRAAEVIEIQSYSMVDDNNYYDIVEKMNDMLSSCVRVKYPDGTIGSYLDIRDPDRFYLIFAIRELTFQQGSNLVVDSVCTCGQTVKIEFKRGSFLFHDINPKISKYFDAANRCFTFETKNDKVFHLSPPTIGLQKSFTDYIVKENAEKKKLNMSFLKIIPFTLYDRTSISYEGIKSKLEEFQKMDDISFQFLNSAVEMMSFGIKKLVKRCQCGLEVHTDMLFPDGPSAVFVIHDAFDQFIKE